MYNIFLIIKFIQKLFKIINYFDDKLKKKTRILEYSKKYSSKLNL